MPGDAEPACRSCGGTLDSWAWCAACDRGGRLRAERWAALLLDDGGEELVVRGPAGADPLAWPGYAESRVAAAGEEAVRAWTGAVEGRACVLIAFDFGHFGGSMGSGVGERVVAAFALATARRLPVVTVTATGGARMQEGMVSLVQMGRTTGAALAHADAGLLQVTVASDPTTGGVYVSFAAQADLLVAEPGAYVGFAGPRVVQSLSGGRVAADVNRAEFALRHGLVDAVVPRPQLRAWVGRALRAAHDGGGPAPAAAASATAAAGPAPTALASTEPPSPPAPLSLPPIPAAASEPAAAASGSAWERVRAARDPARPRAAAYLVHLDDVVLLSGDRAGGTDPGVLAGLASLDGRRFGFVALDRRPVGPAGYRIAQRLLRLAGRLGLGVLTLVDTPGADPGEDAEAAGQAAAISSTFATLLRVPSPTVALVTGEGGSGGALALAVADRLLMQAGAVFSVIAPEGAAAILHRDSDRAPEVAELLKLVPEELVRLGVADAVVPDDPEAALRAAAATLGSLMAEPPATRLAARFRRYGAPADPAAPAARPDAGRDAGAPADG